MAPCLVTGGLLCSYYHYEIARNEMDELVLDLSDGSDRTIEVTTAPCFSCMGVTTVRLDTLKYHRWAINREHIQNVWPELDNDQRELLMTGTHAHCWAAMFPEDENE